MCLGFDYAAAYQVLEEQNKEQALKAARENFEKNGSHAGVNCDDCQVFISLHEDGGDGYAWRMSCYMKLASATGETKMYSYPIPAKAYEDLYDGGEIVCCMADLTAFAKPRSYVQCPIKHDIPVYRSCSASDGGGSEASAEPVKPVFRLPPVKPIVTGQGVTFPLATSACLNAEELAKVKGDDVMRGEMKFAMAEACVLALLEQMFNMGIPPSHLFEMTEEWDEVMFETDADSYKKAEITLPLIEPTARLAFITELVPYLIEKTDMLIVMPNAEMKEGSFSFNFRYKELPEQLPFLGLVHNDEGAAEPVAEGEPQRAVANKRRKVDGALHVFSNVPVVLRPRDAAKGGAVCRRSEPVRLFSGIEHLGTHHGPCAELPHTLWEDESMQKMLPDQEVAWDNDEPQYRSLHANQYYGACNDWAAHHAACQVFQKDRAEHVMAVHEERLQKYGGSALKRRLSETFYYIDLNNKEFPAMCTAMEPVYTPPAETPAEMRERLRAAHEPRAAKAQRIDAHTHEAQMAFEIHNLFDMRSFQVDRTKVSYFLTMVRGLNLGYVSITGRDMTTQMIQTGTLSVNEGNKSEDLAKIRRMLYVLHNVGGDGGTMKPYTDDKYGGGFVDAAIAHLLPSFNDSAAISRQMVYYTLRGMSPMLVWPENLGTRNVTEDLKWQNGNPMQKRVMLALVDQIKGVPSTMPGA